MKGGKRPGAGRPPGSKRGRSTNPTLTMRFPAFELSEIDRLAEESGITRHDWLLRVVRNQLQATRTR